MLTKVESFSSKFTSFFSLFPINFIPESGNYNFIPKSGNYNLILNILFSKYQITINLITSYEKEEETANEKEEEDRNQKKKKKNGADDVNKGINFIQVSNWFSWTNSNSTIQFKQYSSCSNSVSETFFSISLVRENQRKIFPKQGKIFPKRGKIFPKRGIFSGEN